MKKKTKKKIRSKRIIKKSKIILQPPKEFENIVEYCYHTKHQKFVVRFLDGSSYTLKITDLPPKLQTRKPTWEEAILSPMKSSLVVPCGSGAKEIPSHLIHSRGKLVD